jgi:glycine/D-amino acid oxidase-like deaminating enzyme/nitrite reductase/ring-hydroxylating ferredoxin subunit
MKRDGNNESIWQQSAGPVNKSAAINTETLYDAVVAGGGITGITTALLLQLNGKNTLLAEAQNIGFGTTGGTTAHLNNFFDSSYDEVIKNFGLENAKLFADAGREAMAFIKESIESYAIDCAYEEMTAYLFSVEEKQNKILDDIIEGTKKVNIPIDYINDSPFAIPYLKIAQLPQQAQFNPLKYITALVNIFIDNGGTLVENCRVTGADEATIIKVHTTAGDIQAKHLIYATHIPPGVNLLHFRNAPYRSYAMAVKLKGDKYPQALGYDLCDPYHYYRSQKINGEEYLIAGGEDHKTGHEENTDKCFRSLESYVRNYFDVTEVAYKWSSQYYIPADGLPYIGHLPGNGDTVFTATGFNGNGMILGTIAGKIICDLVLTGESKYKQLFSPDRLKPVAGFTNFVTEAADVVAHLIGDRFNIEKIEAIAQLAAGEAKVLKYEGHVIALYKDEQHQLHAVNSLCTHIDCTVSWNGTERTWDCPCHGSRFSIDGEMLTAPARKDLQKIDL